MSDQRVTVTDETSGKSLELPVIKGTEGEPCLQIKALPSTLGYFTYDPGYTATASCTSKITFIDGGKGILRYRGYPIEQLAENSSFLEVAYLLLEGELPTADEFKDFQQDITYHTMIHERLKSFIGGFHYDAHPMAMMAGVVGSLAAFYHDKMDMENPEHRMLAAKRMIQAERVDANVTAGRTYIIETRPRAKMKERVEVETVRRGTPRFSESTHWIAGTKSFKR